MSLSTRLALSFTPLFVAVGSFVADFNETHVLNPRWPPHARYHNGQTMSMGLGLCLGSIYFAWRLPNLNTAEAKREALVASWVLGSMYCVTGLSAILYPGSSGVDPEFFSEGVGHFPQKWIFGLPLLVNGVAFWLEWTKIGAAATKAKGL